MKWLTRSSNDEPYCNICGITLKAAGGKKDLHSHAQTKKHKKNLEAVTIHAGSNEILKGLSKKTSHAEVKLAAFCAEHNIAFMAMDHLTPLIKSTFEQPKVAKNITCGRTKTTGIVKNVLGAAQLDFLMEMMRTKPFSLCADESTDCSTTKLLSLVVRIEYKSKVFDFFLNCLPVIQCDAEGIYNVIVNFFVENNINYKDMLFGFAADGANVMTGGNKSVATLLKKDCPNLVIIKCTCHSLALCSSKACAKLPEFVESTVRDVYNFMANSPKRVSLFSSLQSLLDIKPVKMLHPSQTRWLSLEAVVVRILDNLDVLKLYFIHEEIVHLESSQRILKTLKNPVFEMYLEFLKFVLLEINNVNRLFQSESPQIHSIDKTLRRLILTFLDFFTYINNDDLESILEISATSEMIKPIDEAYFGANVEVLLLESTTQIKSEFQKNCINFYVALCNEMFKKFDFNNKIFKSVEMLAPKHVIEKKFASIAKLLVDIPYLKTDKIQSIDMEWRTIRNIDFQDLDLNENSNIELFWHKILSLKYADGTFQFPLLQKVVCTTLTLPISTANVERIFSQININKTKIRNRLQTSTLNGILHTKDYMKRTEQNCFNLEENNNLLNYFKNNIYK